MRKRRNSAATRQARRAARAPAAAALARAGRQRDAALRALAEAEARSRSLFDQAPVAYAEMDCSGAVVRFNAPLCELLKLPAAEIAASRGWDLLAGEDPQAFREMLAASIESGAEAAPREWECVPGDGRRITVEVRETLIRNAAGAVTGLRRSLVDVTSSRMAAAAAHKVTEYAMELRDKNEQLAHALEAARSAAVAKGRFLAGVSHELRTPLNGIIGFSELLHDGRLGLVPDAQRECLADILHSGRHLLHLINDVLDLSKIEAGKMEFWPERCRIADLAAEVRDGLRPLAEKKRIPIRLEVDPELCATLDPARFKQVLYNYLSNAVKFTQEGGQVTVRAARQDSAMFVLEVEDNGAGIAANEVPMLFQEFQQLTSSRKAEQGTGLGLALTRSIVEAQGGYVGVESAPGEGSVFSAALPLSPGAPKDVR